MDLIVKAVVEEKAGFMEKDKGDWNGNTKDQKTKEKTEIYILEENWMARIL